MNQVLACMHTVSHSVFWDQSEMLLVQQCLTDQILYARNLTIVEFVSWYTTLTEKLISHELILLHVFARLPRFKVLWKNGVISDILPRQNTLTLKTFFLRVLNTKNFTHYHDMFPSTAGKKSMLQIYFATLLHIALSFI